ncbi:IS66 family insertion sequence element accessory protein TnpB [Methylococcus sp. Mc7]|nr:IS66 family insertion sequence element accessory protein TnpB [Methylococcus sp. Mc7]
MLATLLSATTVYVVAEPCDLRKSIDGLALAVESSLGHSPLSGSVFVFFNRGRDKVKLLWWDRHGFSGWPTSGWRKAASAIRFRGRFRARTCCCCWKAWTCRWCVCGRFGPAGSGDRKSG